MLELWRGDFYYSHRIDYVKCMHAVQYRFLLISRRLRLLVVCCWYVLSHIGRFGLYELQCGVVFAIQRFNVLSKLPRWLLWNSFRRDCVHRSLRCREIFSPRRNGLC